MTKKEKIDGENILYHIIAMNIIDEGHLLNPDKCDLLKLHASKTFNIGGYASLDDILTRLHVDVYIEPGIPKRTLPPSLEEALRFWEDMDKRIRKEMEKTAPEGKRETLDKELMKVYGIIQHIQSEKGSWSGMPLRGLYDSKETVIKLFPEEMRTEYDGERMEELLVSTLAHETMHAYFDRPGHKYASVCTVEEPLAEFGMLLYLYDTRSAYYDWAYEDVESKRTCYQYGAVIMDQYLSESSPSPTRLLLEKYKFKLEGYPVIKGKAGGVVLCAPKKEDFGVDETSIGEWRTGGKLPMPTGPSPVPSSTTTVATMTVVVRETKLCQFVKEVFIYLEGERLLDRLGPYIFTKRAKHLRTITNGADFNLSGMLYDTSCLRIDTDYRRLFLIPFVIVGKTYYLSREWYGKGSYALLFDEFEKMIEYVYSERFDIQKEGNDYILVEF